MRSQKYGAKIRKLHDAATAAKRARYECPRCHKNAVKRVQNARWKCRSCGHILAGGAYFLNTEAGEVNSRLMNEYSKK